MNTKSNTLEWVIKEFNELNIYELYEILKLRNEIFIIEQKCIYQDIDEKDKDCFHIFSMKHSKVCSYLRVLRPFIRYKEVSIGRVLTSEKYRDNKLSKTNIILALDFIKISLNEKKVRISAQEHLINFYSTIGFKKVSETYLEDGIPHVEMLIDLTNWSPSR